MCRGKGKWKGREVDETRQRRNEEEGKGMTKGRKEKGKGGKDKGGREGK